MAFNLTDDGTMDTVVVCEYCGAEERFNYDGPGDNPDTSEWTEAERAAFDANGTMPSAYAHGQYEAWIDECLDEAQNDHECHPGSADPEPQDDDITTEDHKTFYQSGKRVLACLQLRGGTEHWYAYDAREFGEPLGKFPDYRAALRAYMERSQFWPNCWFISDHGNAHLIELS